MKKEGEIIEIKEVEGLCSDCGKKINWFWDTTGLCHKCLMNRIIGRGISTLIEPVRVDNGNDDAKTGGKK